MITKLCPCRLFHHLCSTSRRVVLVLMVCQSVDPLLVYRLLVGQQCRGTNRAKMYTIRCTTVQGENPAFDDTEVQLNQETTTTNE